MKKDLENIIITFGLIAIVFVQGSIAYKKKMDEEYAAYSLAAAQETYEKIRTDRLARQAEEERLAQAEAARQEALRQAQLALAAQSVVPQQPVVPTPTPVPVPAPVVQQPVAAPVHVVVRPSRQSRAS